MKNNRLFEERRKNAVRKRDQMFLGMLFISLSSFSRQNQTEHILHE